MTQPEAIHLQSAANAIAHAQGRTLRELADETGAEPQLLRACLDELERTGRAHRDGMHRCRVTGKLGAEWRPGPGPDAARELPGDMVAAYGAALNELATPMAPEPAYERCIVCGVAHQEPCGGLDGKGLGCPRREPTTQTDHTTPA